MAAYRSTFDSACLEPLFGPRFVIQTFPEAHEQQQPPFLFSCYRRRMLGGGCEDQGVLALAFARPHLTPSHPTIDRPRTRESSHGLYGRTFFVAEARPDRERDDLKRVSTHSLKTTLLSWIAKSAQMTPQQRRVLLNPVATSSCHPLGTEIALPPNTSHGQNLF